METAAELGPKLGQSEPACTTLSVMDVSLWGVGVGSQHLAAGSCGMGTATVHTLWGSASRAYRRCAAMRGTQWPPLPGSLHAQLPHSGPWLTLPCADVLGSGQPLTWVASLVSGGGSRSEMPTASCAHVWGEADAWHGQMRWLRPPWSAPLAPGSRHEQAPCSG